VIQRVYGNTVGQDSSRDVGESMLFLIMVERLERRDLGRLAPCLPPPRPLHVLLLQDARNQVLV
jgi:hypothetical protein